MFKKKKMAQASKFTSSSKNFSPIYPISYLNLQPRPFVALPNSSIKPNLSKFKVSPYNFQNSAIFNHSLIRNIKFLGRSHKLANQARQFSASEKSLVKGEEEQVVPSSWIEVVFPEKVQPYAYLVRLDKPIGTFLFAWPCMWSVAFTANPGTLPDLKMLAFFFMVSFMSRNIACTINDYFDKDFDAKVMIAFYLNADLFYFISTSYVVEFLCKPRPG